MKLNKFNKIISETSLEEREKIRFSMKAQERIHELLNLKFNGKQKLLADKMGISEAAVSKFLSGIPNYKIQTLIKLQIAFQAPIIAVCSEMQSDNISVLEVKKTHQIPAITVTVNDEGFLKEEKIEYQSFKSLQT